MTQVIRLLPGMAGRQESAFRDWPSWYLGYLREPDGAFSPLLPWPKVEAVSADCGLTERIAPKNGDPAAVV